MEFPVRKILDVYEACHPERPLEPGDSRYVELRELRGDEFLARNIHRRIHAARHPEYHQHLITGHRGSGKSTELRKIQEYLEEKGYFCIYFDAEEMLDVNELEYLDVLLGLARSVFEALSEQDRIQLPAEKMKALDEWFADVVISETAYEEAETTLKTSFGVNISALVLRFLVAATGVMRSGGEQRKEVRRRLQRKQNAFIERLNDLLTTAQEQLQSIGYQSLVVIVDGLEKMPYRRLDSGESNHSVFFVQHAEVLKQPNCHILYTVPISLKMNRNLADSFPDDEVVPAITPEERGKEALREVIERRVDIDSIFEDAHLVDGLIEICGGSIRDLLRSIRYACDHSEDVIDKQAIQKAIKKLVLSYDYQVKKESLEALQQLHETGEMVSEASAQLLHQRIVVEYIDEGDERRQAIHPAVRRIPRVAQALSA